MNSSAIFGGVETEASLLWKFGGLAAAEGADKFFDEVAAAEFTVEIHRLTEVELTAGLRNFGLWKEQQQR